MWTTLRMWPVSVTSSVCQHSTSTRTRTRWRSSQGPIRPSWRSWLTLTNKYTTV
ncbi:hypothetical protein J4Q44_G00265280 [Coregonus suidteri]|uniref:Uncharacterized protein n=1 Tax=Coregonus suidteri TaxID=861788 RepID=A0AAN8KZB8_9TELE